MSPNHSSISEPQRVVLIFGAGKSATVLIRRLLSRAPQGHWRLVVVDQDLDLARQKCQGHPYAQAVFLDIREPEQRRNLIGSATIVISMLPPTLHDLIAEDCVALRKNLLTASYLDENIKRRSMEIQQNGLLFLCEMGLDPGIDHMSALQLIHGIQGEGGHITQFVSHCGGLVAPSSDDNPWHYKISWNPANIVNAGKAGAVFKQNGQLIEVNYPQMFKDCPTVSLPGLGAYAYYPNRDAAAYAQLYGLQDATTFMRTTLRHPDFCKGWFYLATAGLTADTALDNFSGTSGKDYFLYCLEQRVQVDSFEAFLTQYVDASAQQLIRELFGYLGLLKQEALDRGIAPTASRILQSLLEKKLVLKKNDRDMILMLHEIAYELNGTKYEKKSYMMVEGDNQLNTAMAKTVGLPLAIATELILEGQLELTGLHIPIIPEIYEPVLRKLKENEIRFEEI